MLNRTAVLEHFKRISQIPRCSKQEEKICKYLLDWAKDRGLAAYTDPTGNLLIQIPATPQRENSPGIVLQAHLDMVCEKNPESPHDFNHDPIQLIEEGDWLKAKGTTLGADNGIGIALALALAEDPKISRPPLELLFTVDEETGLTGARGLEPGFFSGRTLINLDSEDDGVLTIGCAGGRDCELRLPLARQTTPDEYRHYRLTVSGLRGGHSGVDIHEQRGNANVILAQVLHKLTASFDFQLAGLQGGSAHNAIPRAAEAILALPPGSEPTLMAEIVSLTTELRKTESQEPTLVLELAETSEKARTCTQECTLKIIDLLLTAPHGVIAHSSTVAGLVETSLNFATIKERDDHLVLLFSLRSDRPAGLSALTDRLAALARLSGATFTASPGYPGWQPDYNSPLLARASQVYQTLYGIPPKIEVIHAGLECGLIGAANPGMDMISLGPTIKNPHSPEEKLDLPSLDRFCRFLSALFG
ncbi:MAG: aminoacyl-histidine dipeptidase [Proteobacteria bacterium]|nr:aminoacyl-histidine dipeptidase [Pseudomonadota bacterium]MBU1688585.1 aminoacyl-histidine dipeptidase [Pseudomonadota bacterium]